MADISLKLKIGETEIDLQGDSEVVERIFTDIKSNGLGKLSLLQEQTARNKEEIDSNTDSKEVINNNSKITDKNKLKQKPRVEKKVNSNLNKRLQLISLGFTKQNVADLVECLRKAKVKTVQDQSLVLMYWYNQFKGSETFEESFSPELIFSLFHNAGIKQAANIRQSLINIVNRTTFLEHNPAVKGEFLLTLHGVNHIEELFKGENN